MTSLGSIYGGGETSVSTGKERCMTLFKALRPLPLMHNWVFWFDRSPVRRWVNDRYSPDMKGYQDQLVEIAEFNTVRVYPCGG
jgi:hypothetical protein